MTFEDLGPFDVVYDVGGNVGDFAEHCHELWPAAAIVSFEPQPEQAEANRLRANGRWTVNELALADGRGRLPLHLCLNQHSASTLRTPGPLRERLGYRDRWQTIIVSAAMLDDFPLPAGRTLLKLDVEGAEDLVLAGGAATLRRTDIVVCELNLDPGAFQDGPAPAQIIGTLERFGFRPAHKLGELRDGAGRLLQYDGVFLKT